MEREWWEKISLESGALHHQNRHALKFEIQGVALAA
jgi:hypothetical protein